MLERLSSHVTRDRPDLARYAIAVSSAVGALVVNYFLRIEFERNLFFISLAAIVISSSLAGYGPGAVTTLLTSVGLNCFFLQSTGSARLESMEDYLRIGTFLLTGMLMTAVGGSLRHSLATTQAARSEAENALRARDEFMSIVSHELKTPLTALKLQAELGLRRLLRSESTRSRQEHEATLRSTSLTLSRIGRLIEDLQDFSRISHQQLKLEPEVVELGELVRTVIDRLSVESEAREIRLETRLQAGLIGYWDALRIEQVVTNLLSNAIKYGRHSPIEVGTEEDGQYAILYVRDHGPGISDADQARLFQRFERVHATRSISGLGLGLYITRTIVSLHQGTIRVENTPGGGATFRVRLPLNLSSGAPQRLTAVDPEAPAHSSRSRS